MPDDNQAILRLPALGGIEVSLVRDTLTAIDQAYTGYVAFDRLLSSYAQWFEPARRWSRAGPPPPAAWWYEAWEDVPSPYALLLGGERLILYQARLSSPGFLEFLGGLNPLQVILTYLNDRHRRRQDREYREREEARQLGLENDLRELDLIKKKIELARESGVPDDTIVLLVNQLVGQPLSEVGRLQDGGVIDGTAAELRPPPEST